LGQVARAGDAPYALLIETKVAFYELLQGRYRWVVYGKVSLARREDLPGAAAADVEAPVFLLYDHEKEAEALRAAAPTLAQAAGGCWAGAGAAGTGGGG